MTMTAHPIKPTLTPERVQWFAEYRRKHADWGAFHIQLADGNPRIAVDPKGSRGEHGEANAIAWFNSLTESQRTRLGRKVDDVLYTKVYVRTAAGSSTSP